MKEHSKAVLVAKGFCMGIADVIPGVSGGTLALILGIYRDFIDSINSINPKPLLALLAWLKSGLKAEERAAFLESLKTIRLGFLIPLGIGIVTALGIGSAIIPSLMEHFPAIMRGLFFGLIVASVFIPLRMIPRDNSKMVAFAVVLSIAGVGAGYTLTNPNLLVDTTSEWVQVEVPADRDSSDPMTLKDAIRRGPSALTAEQVYWAKENQNLRDVILKTDPVKAKELTALYEGQTGAVVTDKHSQKARSLPYNDLVVPAKTMIQVPRPALWFIFVAGSVAICAMVLPGVSGSFLLLVMGCYYFILNALKGSLKMLASGEFPVQSLLYVGLFICGIAVGLLTFARIMSYLLKNHPAPTMGLLVGLMIGCLRGVWPYQSTIDGTLSNVVPTAWNTQEILAIVAMVVGVALVSILTFVGNRLEKNDQDTATDAAL